MKLTNKGMMSSWAFWECKNGNDMDEIRNLITENYDIYLYCEYIKNRKDMREKLKNKIEWKKKYEYFCGKI